MCAFFFSRFLTSVPLVRLFGFAFLVFVLAFGLSIFYSFYFLTPVCGLWVVRQLAVVNPTRDYTPPDRLTLLFTDLGVLTPSAVSDELIQLYL
jgi:translation initiation factor 2B subunit (eIF-2B alpha/beta/delta family)